MQARGDRNRSPIELDLLVLGHHCAELITRHNNQAAESQLRESGHHELRHDEIGRVEMKKLTMPVVLELEKLSGPS